jgi:ferrous iron transport protein A
MPCGCRLRVSNLAGSPSSRSRLYAMGILPGAEMEVCQSGGGTGSVCVRVRQSSVVLGEKLARSIYCRMIDDVGEPWML